MNGGSGNGQAFFVNSIVFLLIGDQVLQTELDEQKEDVGFFAILNCKEVETLLKELARTAL